MKSEILKLLKESCGYVSGQQLCDRFAVSRTAVWKVMEQLKKEGYELPPCRQSGRDVPGGDSEPCGYFVGCREGRLF